MPPVGLRTTPASTPPGSARRPGNIRRKAKDDLDALKEVGEDEISRAEKDLEATTKQHVDAIDDALKRKEAELLEV